MVFSKTILNTNYKTQKLKKQKLKKKNFSLSLFLSRVHPLTQQTAQAIYDNFRYGASYMPQTVVRQVFYSLSFSFISFSVLFISFFIHF